ncbi:hypothetical protein ACM26V_03665 [Salipaludibacillus sp. HK11]|uniref:hypothetical protein n=1 Tax=Salipaludibacillus sp. HK11 TaxID=3394320 RepID=UPI0039FCA779
MIKKVTVYDDIIAVVITVIFSRYIGRDLLGLHIDMNNIILSSFLAVIFIFAFFHLSRVSISLLLGFVMKRLKKQ